MTEGCDQGDRDVTETKGVSCPRCVVTEMRPSPRGVVSEVCRDRGVTETEGVMVTKHTGNFGQDTSAIGHQAHGKLPEGAKTHRPSATKHTGNFGQDTSAIGHQAHGKLRPSATKYTGKLWPRHIGHRPPSTWETSAKTHRPSATKHTGNFGQDTSAIGHQAHRKFQPSATKHTGKLRPRHIGHRPPSTRETLAKTHRPSVTKRTGNFLKVCLD